MTQLLLYGKRWVQVGCVHTLLWTHCQSPVLCCKQILQVVQIIPKRNKKEMQGSNSIHTYLGASPVEEKLQIFSHAQTIGLCMSHHFKVIRLVGF